MPTVTIDQRTGGLVLPLEDAARGAARNLPDDLAALRRHLDSVVGLIVPDRARRGELDPDVATELLLAVSALGSLASNVDDLVASVDNATG